jgi:hypothetical protein
VRKSLDPVVVLPARIVFGEVLRSITAEKLDGATHRPE